MRSISTGREGDRENGMEEEEEMKGRRSDEALLARDC